MFIVYGKTIVRHEQGKTAGFCPVCRTIHHFGVFRVGRTDHLYGIPIGRGEHVADEMQCAACGMVLGGAPNTIPMLSVASNDPTADLAILGGPVQDAARSRFELEARARAGSISPEERRALLAEPFQALRYAYDLSALRGPRDMISALLIMLAIAAIIGTVGGAYANIQRPVSSGYDWMVRCGIATAVLLPASIIRIASVSRRSAVKPLIAPLARALEPLRPRPGEVEGVLEQLRAERNPFALAVNAQQVTGGNY